jgi:hypothetical protein
MHVPFMFVLLTGVAQAGDVGPLVRALWLVQQHGTAEALDPANDERVKGVLAKALAKDGVLSFEELGDLMTRETFDRLAGADGKLDADEMARAVAAAAPPSRTQLAPNLRAHADYLSTTFDLIDEPHRRAGKALADWIAANYRPGTPLHVTVICTGNSRRSIMGASMGNLAAAYCGMPDLHFHSGGTAPTAFNPRTVAALRAIGFEVSPTGNEAPRGEPKTANPAYRIAWGEGFEAIEFSKRYDDPSNPQSGFAALMVCGDADAECPTVHGSALRVSMPYLDPKIYDGGAYESIKYAERRDDIGRLMLSALMQAQARMGAKETVRGR